MPKDQIEVDCIRLFGGVPKKLETHHSTVPLTSEDRYAGQVIAWFLGDLFFPEDASPVQQWSRVTRALRIHGMKIVTAETVSAGR